MSRSVVAALAVAAAVGGCGRTPQTGVLVQVSDGPGVAAASVLLLDWFDDRGPIFRDRRVAVATGAQPVSVGIELPAGARGRRQAVVHGLDGSGALVSAGEGMADVSDGQWVTIPIRLAAVDLMASIGKMDAGAPAAPDASSPMPAPPDGPAPDRAPGPEARPPDAPANPRTDAGAPEVTPPPDTAPATDGRCHALLAVAGPRTSLTPADEPVRVRLVGLACDVVVQDEGVLADADLAGRNLVVVATTAGNSPSYAKSLRSWPHPIVTLEYKSYRDLALTLAADGVDFGLTGAATNQLAVLDPQHAIARGVPSPATILTMPNVLEWGYPRSGATRIAAVPGAPATQVVVFAYEAGAVMVNQNAPARRVAIGIEEADVPRLTGAGWQLFDNAVRWAIEEN